jgi:hypothetical protein
MREITQGLKQVFGVTGARLSTVAKKGGSVALATRGQTRWWLDAHGDDAWSVRLDWEPALATWRPKGVAALARWRWLLAQLSQAVGVSLDIEADEDGALISLRFPCALAGVFEAATRLEALTAALTALDLGGDAEAAALTASAATPPQGTPWAVIPTVGCVRWVAGRIGEAGTLPDGALLLIFSADQAGVEEVVRWALARRFGAEVAPLALAPWARQVAASQAALPAEDAALLTVRWPDGDASPHGSAEALRLLGGVLPRWRASGWEPLRGHLIASPRLLLTSPAPSPANSPGFKHI